MPDRVSDTPRSPPHSEARIGGRYQVIRALAEGSSGRTLLCADSRGDRVAGAGKYAELFSKGEFTEGVIVSADKGATYATFRYEYEVGRETYVGFMEYAQELTRYWGKGDTVPVLYDRDDPSTSCFVYR